jgi:hypothetical protein
MKEALYDIGLRRLIIPMALYLFKYFSVIITGYLALKHQQRFGLVQVWGLLHNGQLMLALVVPAVIQASQFLGVRNSTSNLTSEF